MLKFVKGHMESIDGIALYPIIAFVIFFTFFVGLSLYVIFQRRERMDQLSQIPFDESNQDEKSMHHE
ncbi:MAG: CcoQ/FixQ family Cbb3-type cytochrome c oxidase assembly chaperone [Cryomorphaceae bacterium]|nr:MAG: CcoQ/FixQ family Cbb3-type cytochrome c oxidase assembly chaperone [Cryomorphaceae bacterium]